MRFFIFNKKSLIMFLFCFILLATAVSVGIVGTKAAINTATQKRELPIYYVDKEEKVVSLSFDAAWGNEQTSSLIKILQDYNVKATFFLVGDWVDKYPDSVKEISDSGNEIGNHSDTHPHMSKLSSDKIKNEVTSCNEKIKNITGKSPELFRAPYGEYNNQVVEAIKGLNMYCIQWDVDSLDWKDPTAKQITDKILNKVKPGSIVLMHNGAKNTPEALPMIIKGLQDKGYKIVPISQIIYKEKYKIDTNGKQILDKN